MVPNAYVARHSRHLSANTSGENILLSYEDFSNVLNVIYGVKHAQTFEWRNITSDVLSVGSPDVSQLTEMCSFSYVGLYCFMTINQTSHLGIMSFMVYVNASNVSQIDIYSRSR